MRTASTRALGQEDGWLEHREGQSIGEKIKEVRDGRPECVDPAGHRTEGQDLTTERSDSWVQAKMEMRGQVGGFTQR